MLETQFYFLSDQYYLDFPDDKLMKNKDMIDGKPHKRPCFFTFPDSKIPDIYWIVPISSQYEKFKRIEQEKIQKYGRCNTIRFGTVLGRNALAMAKRGAKVIFPDIFKIYCSLEQQLRIKPDFRKF
ncbi:MAG: hypothetical protein Q4C65_05810 [Eubacteriales bacterium]|nr:hypothetical protein [Eubacteriales bacterium]